MSTITNQVADAEGDIEVIDFPETNFPVLPKDNQISKVGQVSSYWGDLSKYADEDFDHLLPRLIVPSLVAFVKPSNAQANPLAKMVIQNTSNLPMTYSVHGFPGPFKTRNPKIVRVTKPEPGWIPPKSSALLSIQIDVDKDIKVHYNVWEHFTLHAAPIFREKHTQKENLELLWKAFDSECFPKSHAEEHVFTINITGLRRYSNTWMLRVKPPKDFRINQEQISQEKFNALWVAGEDQQEYKFALELRVRELNRVMKCAEVEARTKLENEKRKWEIILIDMMIGMITITIVFLSVFHMAKRMYRNDEDDDY